MQKLIIAAFILFFASLSQAARIISFQNGYLALRSDPPNHNFIELMFPKLKNAIFKCDSGDWEDWTTATLKGRTCDNFKWNKDLSSGCESILIPDDSATDGSWSIAFNDKATCAAEEIYFHKYSNAALTDETSYQYEITLKGTASLQFCNSLLRAGATRSETNGWTTLNLNNLAQCVFQNQNFDETLEATVLFK
jgi:hypothetical protein